MSSKPTFKTSIQRLEEIVNTLERNEVELEEAIKIYEEGLKLVKQCNTQLTNFEKKIAAIVEVDGEGK